MKVWYVEDDEGVRESIAEVLERRGHEVLAFAEAQAILSALRALREAPTAQPDALFTDLMLRGEEAGRIVIVEARVVRVRTIVLVSGHDDRARTIAREENVLFIPKPIRIPAILGALTEERP